MKRIASFVLLAILLIAQAGMAMPPGVAAQPIFGSPETEVETTPTSTLPPVIPPTEPPVIPPTEEIQAADVTELVIGGQVRVNVALLNVRENPGTNQPIVGRVSFGAIHTMLDGPVDTSGFLWFEIGIDNERSGWVAGQYIDYLPEGAATSTVIAATATNAAPSGAPRIGDIVAVTVGVLNARSGPSTSNGIVRTITLGQTYTVIDGPRSGSGYTWVKLDLPGATDGWAVTQYLQISSRPDPTSTAIPSNTATPSNTPVPTNTSSPTLTSTPSLTPTLTSTPTFTPTLTGSETATSTATHTSTSTPTSEATATKVSGAYNPGDVIVVTASLNVRSGPGTGNSVRMVASSGTQATVLTGNTPGGSYTWAEIQLSGTTGWVAINYIKHLSFATATPPASTSQVTISLNCTTNPERIAITNGNSSGITIISIETHYDAGSNEPFVLNQALSGGQTRTYLAGSNASGTFRLTSEHILTDSAGTSEGVTVVTSAGTVSQSCSSASSADRWVEVDISSQYMRVYQGTELVAGTYVSTGRYGFDTPLGTYYTWLRYTSQTMSGCIRGECYVTPNVPWVHYFTYYGHALHGAYWHNNFGNRMSHGCVNLPLPFAEWLYYWLPMGSRVVVKQ